ncbi:MAG: hypothetical protein HC808_14855 [Candidatus Competibacteraceae bacterium]|nr:hypothetical protein [Candidatus Competibacteraceae bacterium]
MNEKESTICSGSKSGFGTKKVEKLEFYLGYFGPTVPMLFLIWSAF